MTNCLIADDHPPILAALSRYLPEHGFEIVGTASTGEEAVEKLERMRPPVALVDMRMPGLDGLEVVRRVVLSSAGTALIVYTGAAGQADLQAALDAGARGFVMKEAPLPDLVRALQTAERGGVYVDPVLAGLATTHDRSPTLTARERDVLRLLADGCSNEEIGRKLFISPETVRAHVAKACRKLGARTRTQAVATALRLALIA
ncbi:MAG: response regulator transcription factor [Actinobacteria bacterium]|nr:response regulator transcription factor [Actinomycetota bacterium]